MYFKHLAAAFGNVIMSSVYRVVDMGIIEKYQGSTETVTLIIVSSVWKREDSICSVMSLTEIILRTYVMAMIVKYLRKIQKIENRANI